MKIQNALDDRFREERRRTEITRIGTISALDTSNLRLRVTVAIGNGQSSKTMAAIDTGVTLAVGDVVAFLDGPDPVCLGRLKLS